MAKHYLDSLFAPRSVAIFGASDREESLGSVILKNVCTGGFKGKIYPINPKRKQVGGLDCFPSIDVINEPIDLALIATPAATVPELVRQCGERGVRSLIIFSAGFGETAGDEQGAALREQVLTYTRRYRMRLVGPNCLGLIRPDIGLNATFSKNTAAPGTLALISQSGALCTAILDWAEPRHLGFSAVVSLGSASDVDFGELLHFFALDAKTRAIVLYIEGIGNSRRFLSGLRSAARLKPIIVVKAGRQPEGARAALSHTGALVGADDVFDAALARAGAVRATTVEQLFAAAQLLSVPRRARGNHLAIVTNAGGPGVLATDRASDLGVALSVLAPETISHLNEVLPKFWSHGNPIDVLGDAGATRYADATSAALADPNVDGALVMLTPQAMTDPLAIAKAVIDAHAKSDKPVIACWMGATHVSAGRKLLAEHGIPAFENPETAIEAFGQLSMYQRNQQLLMEVPPPFTAQREPDAEGVRLIIEQVLSEGRELLDDNECRAVLTAFGIGVMPGQQTHSPNEAMVAAESIGFPVVLKIASLDISHKSDVNGVRLNVGSAAAVRLVYRDLVEAVQRERPEARIAGVTVEKMYRSSQGRELHIGVIRDQVFGPVISFGLGGTSIELLGDRAVALPPLNTLIARDLIRRTKAAKALGKFRQLAPINYEALEQTLLRVSELVCQVPEIREMDLNPIVSDTERTVALDVRIVVDRASRTERYPHMAIHPYPSELASKWITPEGNEIVIRPIRPEDAKIERDFIHNLSPEAKHLRFMQTMQELTPEMLVRFTQIDYDREMALIAVSNEKGVETQVAVARFGTNPDGESCEFAIAVADSWCHQGLGTRLLTLLIEHARSIGLKQMEGDVLEQNRSMLGLAQKLGFKLHDPDESRVRHVSLGL